MGKINVNLIVFATIAHALLFQQTYADDIRLLQQDEGNNETSNDATTTGSTEATTAVTTEVTTAAEGTTEVTTGGSTTEAGGTTEVTTTEVTTTAQTNGTVIQTVTISGQIEMSVPDTSVYTSDDGKTMLRHSIASVAGVDADTIEVTVTVVESRRLADDQGRRMTAGSIEVDYTITLPPGDETTTNEYAESISTTMADLPQAEFFEALDTAAEEAGIEVDTSLITGFESARPTSATTRASILDVPWIQDLLELTCGDTTCTINDLVTNCKEENRADHTSLCDQVDAKFAEAITSVGDSIQTHVSTLCKSEAEDEQSCNSVFEVEETVPEDNSNGNRNEEDGAESKIWLPALVFALALSQSH